MVQYDKVKQRRPNRLDTSKTDTLHWRDRSEWNGSEAPRLLFDTLAGHSGLSDGILSEVFMYRGFNLIRLFEGTWITMVWPRWFQELDILDRLASQHSNMVEQYVASDTTRHRAAQCVMSRYHNLKNEFRYSMPVERGFYSLIKEGKLIRSLSMIRAVWQLLRKGSKAPSEKFTDVALFPWSEKIAPHILPLAGAIAASGRLSMCIAGWETAPPFKFDANWQWDTPVAMRSSRILIEAWRAVGELRERWIEALHNGRIDPLGEWRGWDIRPLLVPFLQACVNHLYSVIVNVLTAEEWCKHRRLKGIVVPQDGGLSVRSLIAGAQLAGIRSFSVQYGYSVDSAEISEPVEDIAFLNGNFTKQCFLRRKASPSKIVVVGSTAYDGLLRLRSEGSNLRCKLMQRYNLDSSRPWIVVATWFEQSLYSRKAKEAELAVIMEALGRLSKVQVLVKLHPSDKDSGKLELAAAQKYDVDTRIVEGVAENDAILCAADAFISNYTTLAVMAVLAKTPVIIIDLSGMQKPPKRAYVDEGVADFANTVATAETAIKNIMNSGKDGYWERRCGARSRFIAERLHVDDGQAAIRMADIIQNRLNT